MTERTGICHECGCKHGSRRPSGAHTRWGGRCRWCGRFFGIPDTPGVTSPRHYGWPDEPKET